MATQLGMETMHCKSKRIWLRIPFGKGSKLFCIIMTRQSVYE